MDFEPAVLHKTTIESDSITTRASSSALHSSVLQLDAFSDIELMQLVKEGSSECVAVLFTRHRPLVLSIALRILRDRCEAEDVTQDVFLDVLSKAARFDPALGTVKVWIIQLAYSRSLHRRRDLMTRRYDEDALNMDAHPDVEYEVWRERHEQFEASYLPDLVERLTFEKQTQRMIAAFSALTDKQKQTLELVYFQGLLIREVADEIGESVENIRHYYYRGLRKLRDLLASAPSRKDR